MERCLEYQIPSQMIGHKISEFLHQKGFSNQNLAIIKRMPESILIRNAFLPKGVYVDEQNRNKRLYVNEAGERWEYMNYRLQKNDILIVQIREEKVSQKIVPVKLPFPIIYEDKDIVVVNKPANMPIHPSMQNYNNTLGNAAAYYYQQQGKAFVYRCVNRLDKDTTGLTILAKHLVSGSILYDHIVNRRVKREYIAIAEGNVFPKKGTIDLPLGRKPDSAIERMVDLEHGERAITHYEVIENKKDISALRLHLETGRTHQIRVHMAHIGHPLIGDFLYNPNNHVMKRQALHACRLSFPHPITGEQLHFEVPIPEDMRRVLE